MTIVPDTSHSTVSPEVAGATGSTPRPKWRPSLPGRLVVAFYRLVNKRISWDKLPKLLGDFNILALRISLREHNLYHPTLDGEQGPPASAPTPPVALTNRQVDGRYNDLRCPMMGAAATRFGRNFPLNEVHPDTGERLLAPSPRTVSERLLKRDRFRPAESLNLLAAAWIQFQTHDWFNHGDNETTDPIEIPLQPDDPWHEKPMRIARTRRDPTRTEEEDRAGLPPTYVNATSHWWDGSAIYGSDDAKTHKLRSHQHGKLRIENGRLPMDEPATAIVNTGFTTNWWIGLEILHTLFALEHNAICDRLHAAFPDWDDERLFHTARLINAALMAKIHTIEWTPAILAHPALEFGMRANWWGLLGERITRLIGRIGKGEILSGIAGSATNHHSAPFSLTEDFAAVYRMHPLLPDTIDFRQCKSGAPVKTLTMEDVLREKSFGVIDKDLSIFDVFYTFGTCHPGALVLGNFPNFLRKLTLPDGSIIDLAAVDIMRDRERGVPRYNRFRELLRMPRVNSFEELNPEWAPVLREVYEGDIDRVDLLVGSLAEKPPEGFGFSDTIFRIFILMASRRLKSDRFLTDDYGARLYTDVGIEWISDSSMVTVLLRHYPELAPALKGCENAFKPWRARGGSNS